ncbi:putative dithiol-disulfide isomerase involved in polyketide biosynthesis [Hoeflea phototrophica DFL-43]|uniref:Putative dithiol-disulfide isomerase involved in polyketide biosynthesis n=1 Tax=Hoeflea phototrophica (strain DSM 17068 / NCIMB 14078 / DFL-43) TaxID=411684 RepID=A9D993_HOEPD|nr:DsbA family oxidoreductase [Hoeflea phototrophica]EDQ32886.1 putative dithiol-disulfide isomerase involved in polyketide biosynthesis [Hoeflea phototrophica DFL-43]
MTSTPTLTTAPALTIDVVSDVMCPWCYIGKRRLEAALADVRKEMDVEVRWRPYQLDSTLPKQGKDRKQYLEDKFGGPEGAEKAYAPVHAAGVEENIPFALNDIPASANTLDAHRVIRWAGSEGLVAQDATVEALFKAYFEDGKNIGDDEVLIEAATEAGLDREIVARLLAGEADKDTVSAEIDQARQMGVTGVPCFIIDMKYAVVGAQPAEALADAMRKVAQEKLNNPEAAPEADNDA